MTALIILASAAKSNFIVNSTAAHLIGGILFFGTGLLLGRFLWKGLRAEAARFELENQRLHDAYEVREKAFLKASQRGFDPDRWS